MTNVELIESFGVDPTRNLRSSFFRSMDGMLFVKIQDIHGRVKSWCPIFIVSEVVLYTQPSYSYLPTRGNTACQRALQRVAAKFGEKYTVISTESASSLIPDKLCQPPKLRGVPSRQCFIRDIMNHLTRSPLDHAPRYGPDEEETRKLHADESRKIAWEYAITETASKFAKSKKTLEMEMNKAVSSVHAKGIEDGLKDLRKHVMADDFTEAEKAHERLCECVGNLEQMTRRSAFTLSKAKKSTSSIVYRAVSWREETLSPERFDSWRRGSDLFSIKNSNIIEGWVDFSKFLTNLGIDIPRPFGEDLSHESVYRLAAYHSVSAESYFNFKDYIDGKLAELKGGDQEEAKPCNLYLG